MIYMSLRDFHCCYFAWCPETLPSPQGAGPTSDVCFICEILESGLGFYSQSLLSLRISTSAWTALFTRVDITSPDGSFVPVNGLADGKKTGWRWRAYCVSMVMSSSPSPLSGSLLLSSYPLTWWPNAAFSVVNTSRNVGVPFRMNDK